MTTPPPALTDAQVRAFAAAQRLGPVHTIVRPARGSVNAVMLLNNALVLRADVQGKMPGRFASEAEAYRLLAASDVPVPRVILYDDTRAHLPYDVLLTQALPGTALIDVWPTLTAAQQRTAAHQAGVLLARVHEAATWPRYAHLRDLPNGGTTDWPTYVQAYFARYAAPIRAQQQPHGPLDGGTVARAQAALDAARPALAAVTAGHLVHSDYHFENLLADDAGHITAVLDFEWAFSGDPSFDFTVAPKWDAMCPGSGAHVHAGYASVRALDDGHAQRLRAYAVVVALESVADGLRRRDTAFTQWALGQLDAALG